MYTRKEAKVERDRLNQIRKNSGRKPFKFGNTIWMFQNAIAKKNVDFTFRDIPDNYKIALMNGEITVNELIVMYNNIEPEMIYHDNDDPLANDDNLWNAVPAAGTQHRIGRLGRVINDDNPVAPKPQVQQKQRYGDWETDVEKEIYKATENEQKLGEKKDYSKLLIFAGIGIGAYLLLSRNKKSNTNIVQDIVGNPIDFDHPDVIAAKKAMKRNKPGQPAKNNPKPVAKVKSELKKTIDEVNKENPDDRDKVMKEKIDDKLDELKKDDNQGVKFTAEVIQKSIKKGDVTKGIQEVTGNPISVDPPEQQEIVKDTIKAEEKVTGKTLSPDEEELKKKKHELEMLKIQKSLEKYKAKPKGKLENIVDKVEHIQKQEKLVDKIFGGFGGVGQKIKDGLITAAFPMIATVEDVKGTIYTVKKLYEMAKVAYEKGLFSKDEWNAIIEKSFEIASYVVHEKIDLFKMGIPAFVRTIKTIITLGTS